MADKAYGYRHQQARARLLPKAWGTPCPLCGAVMWKTEPLDLDHSTPLALGGTTGDRIVHAVCNRSAGATLGNRLRGRRGSQDW
jgi:hypothetical protein